MARPMTPAGVLGERVSVALEHMREERAQAIAQARADLLAGFGQPPSRSLKFDRRAAQVLAGLALAAAVLIWVAVRRSPNLTFSVDGAPGVLRAWLAAPEPRPLALRFSDGTVLSVRPGARARVVDVDRRGARLALERGELHAEVEPRPAADWWVIAGPFAVHVTGTRFDVRWDPDSERFALGVSEGSVHVSGAIAGDDRAVRAGELLVISLPQARLESLPLGPLADDQRADASRVDPATPAPSVASATAAPSPPPVTGTDAAQRDRGTPSWHELARAGRLKEAYVAAEAIGFSAECEHASPSELLFLGDGARLASRSDRATQALLSLRHRFPQDPRRAAAAFALGKVAFDQRRAYAQAAEWFATCIREQPAGSLAREASGRLVEALRNAGDRAGAEQAARRYLAQYPDGPHAQTARALVQ
jgi:transmembrane sensor